LPPRDDRVATPPVNHGSIPYRIAVLCYLRDAEGRVLMLHRLKMPNAGMYSPIGGKLEVESGEGPHACAVREIAEEAGIALDPGQVRLLGIVSETAYQHETHWLIFLFEVCRAVRHEEIRAMHMDEGTLEWIEPSRLAVLNIPETDRRVMWPLVSTHLGSGFFMVHIDCTGPELKWHVMETRGARSNVSAI